MTDLVNAMSGWLASIPLWELYAMLGLKVEKGTAPMDMFVVDKINLTPTEN